MWQSKSCSEHCQKRWGEIIERLEKLIKFEAQHPLQGQNMIKFKHNRFQISCRKHVEKGMMMQMLQYGIIKSNHLLLNELFKGRKTCVCWGWQKIASHFEMLLERESVVVNLCLGFKKERTLINRKPSSYDRNYKSSTP